MSNGIVLADGSPAADPPPQAVDPLKFACQVIAEGCVKLAASDLLQAFGPRLKGGARLVSQLVLHLPDGTFIMSAASLNKHAPSGTDKVSIGFTTMPVGPGTEKLAEEVAVDRVNANLKEVTAAGLEVVMAGLLEALPDRTLEGRVLVVTSNLIGDNTVCTAVVTGKYGPVPMVEVLDDDDDGPEGTDIEEGSDIGDGEAAPPSP